MIIRLTLGDNEYTEILEKFLDNIIENIINSINFDTGNLVEMQQEFERCSRIMSIINRGKRNEATDNEKGYLIQQIRNAFNSFVAGKRKDMYMINNLSIMIVDSLTDADENKEVVYWLSNSKKVITQ